MEYVLETNGLTKEYSRTAVVNDVSIKVKKGEIYGFVGKNGAGKTTFIRMVLGLTKATRGSCIFFGGEDRIKAQRKIGSLIEGPALYKNMSARRNLEIYSTLLGTDTKNIDEILETVGLSDTGKKRTADFSLGMKQRLGIAMALVGDPEFLILDEPINGLDPKGIVEIRELLTTLKDKGKTIFISSHILGELEKTATCYGIISSGRLVEEISADELKKKCGKRTVIKVNDPVKAKDIISGLRKTDKLEIEGKRLFISGEIPDIGELTNALFKEGIVVSGINEDDNGMEDYFIKKMEEGV